MDRSRRARGVVHSGSRRRRPFVAAALVALAAVLAAPALSSTPLHAGEADAASPRPRDCPKRLGKARFRDGQETVAPSGSHIWLRCGYNLKRGKKGVAVQFIRLQYFIGEASPRLELRDGEPVTFCWQASTGESAATGTFVGQTLTPLEAAVGAPETIILDGREGIIYPIGDRLIKAHYGASATVFGDGEKKKLMNVSRKAAIELAARLADDLSVGVATCPTTPGEIDPTAKAYLAVVERFLEREAEAEQMLLDADMTGPGAGAAIEAAFRAQLVAVEIFAAQLGALALPPDVKDQVDTLIALAEQEANLWRFINSEATGDADAHADDVAEAQDELFFIVTPARQAADSELRELLGLE